MGSWVQDQPAEGWAETLAEVADAGFEHFDPTDVNHTRVGLNPDLGNLVRLHRPVESWESMAAKTLPYANFCHVKNYFRDEDPSTDHIVTIPAPLDFGVINYRPRILPKRVPPA
jgi:hypothetical protein